MLDSENHLTTSSAGATGGVTSGATRGGWPPVLWAGIVGSGIVGAVTAKAVATAVQDTALTNLTLVPQTQSSLYRVLAALLVVACAGGLLLRRPWSGWPLAAAGSAVVWASTTAQASTSDWFVFGFVIGAGAALAGVVNAVAAEATALHRRVLGAALAVGFVAAGELTRLTHWSNVISRDALAATVVTALLGMHAVATAYSARRGAVPASPDTADSADLDVAGAAAAGPAAGAAAGGGVRGLVRRIGAREPRRTAVLLGAAAAVTVLLDEVLRQVNVSMRSGRGLSANRYQAVELVTHFGHIAIVLVVTGTLTVLAWRAGGYVQARWIALGAGLAALLYSGPDALGNLALSPLGGWATLALPAAAAAGSAVVWYVRGSVPWDAYALIVGALATVTASALPDTAGTQHTSTALSHVGLIAFAFALGAAVSDTAAAPDSTGTVADPACLAAGFGAFVLAAAQFAVDPLLNLNLNDRGSMYGAVAAVACGAAAWAVTVRTRRSRVYDATP